MLDSYKQRLEDAFLKPGFQTDPLNFNRTLGHVGSMLEQTGVARHQRRGEKTDHLPEGKIPRHDCEDGADGQVADERSRPLQSLKPWP